MQHDTPTPTAGIDWATDTNELAIIDVTGHDIARLNEPADKAGIARHITTLERHGVTEVAIERPDGPVVDALLAAGMTVFVIPPRQVKNLRSRYGSAGNKDDRFDAFVLADTLRTDRQRLIPLRPDTDQTVAMRSLVRARGDLVETRVAICNQLRAHLRVVFPAAVGLFSSLDSTISLAFLTRFPSQARADWLGPKRLGAWLAANGYCGRTPTTTLLGRITDAPRGLDGDPGDVAAATTLAFVASLATISSQIAALDTRIKEQLAIHPDGPVFTSLPRSGQIRAAKLLVEIGDARGRYPTVDALAALAGAVPSTRQSGRHHVVAFRWACNHKLRAAVMDFAADSRHASPWAAAIYDRHRAQGKTHQHATRILARAWLRVIWRMWHDHTAYNPALHGGARREHATVA